MFDQSYIVRALAELRTRSLHDLQVETAQIWCGRACAAATMGFPGDAREYAHEAIEHAALSGENALLHDVRVALETYDVVL